MRHRLFRLGMLVLNLSLGFLLESRAPGAAAPAETVGKRPYELEWAGRTQDEHAPLVDFESLEGWRVECRDAEARIERTREQQIWGQHVGRLTYRGTGPRPEVRILPPQPVAARAAFDAVTLWCYGNNWGWAPDPSTPQVRLSALFEDAGGREFRVFFYHVAWTEWFLLHRRLTPEQIERAQRGARFKGLLVEGGSNKQDRTLYFDNLAVFTEQFPPLQFAPRPARGVDGFPGQSAGANTGPGRLPFPTRPETILPPNLTADFTVSAREDGGAFELSYRGKDGALTWRYTPRSGVWSDLEARWDPPPGQRSRSAVVFRPCVDGGVYLAGERGAVAPESAEHLGTALKDGVVETRWRLRAGGAVVEATYALRLWNKSLVVDVRAPGGRVGEVRFGRAAGLVDARLVTLPYYPAEGGRPAVAVSGSAEAPLFLMGNVDWYRSSASVLWAGNNVSSNGALYNGGVRYTPLTSGKRNDCYERFFLTVSPRFEEVLPTIPNPVSPWKHITGTRLWQAHGASDRQQDARFWTEAHRLGLTQVVVTDHETMWRDGGESFTFRTRAAPGKGGDAGAADYARLMQDKLGFVYGPYNNFTDFAPVNEFWSADLIARASDNQLQHAWMRCYAPKPARAVEYCERLAPEIQRKFKFSTAYCDVHTAVAPWHRVDYDARAPGAGSFAAVFYAYGEIMLHQKRAWNGPVYSEGNYHAFYCGLTDGNYGQDQSYRPAENPWLVDFDLRRLHDLCCNFGMGNVDMFYASQPQPQATAEQRDARIDRFLAATVAFGHPGFLVFDGGKENAMRSYYLLQQLHSRYCLTNADQIRYVCADGTLLDTSAAVASGEFKRSQVVTRYADGTVTAANGSRSERLRATAFGRALDLPPNGYAGWTEDGRIEVLSGDIRGQRADYADTPAYLYVDGRGRFARFAKAAGNGVGVCRFLGQGRAEIILRRGAECGFAVAAARAIALDEGGKEMGPARLRRARGLTYVEPVTNAFSYRIEESASASAQPPGGAVELRCDREQVTPGERVRVRGREAHEARIPAEARPGQRLWLEFEGAWIDFTVVPLADTQLSLETNTLVLTLTSHLAEPAPFEARIAGWGGASGPIAGTTVMAVPGRPVRAAFELGEPAEESADLVTLELRSGQGLQRVETGLIATLGHRPIGPMPAVSSRGIRLRGRAETPDFGESGAQASPRGVRCGEVEKEALFMHPPYQTGVGYTYVTCEPLRLPTGVAAAFRAWAGKENGSDPGDGVLLKAVVVDAAGGETVVAQTNVSRHEWLAVEADLSSWAGQTVRLKLMADVGPRNDSSGDWGCWAEPRIETRRPMLTRALAPASERFRRVPGPHACSNLTVKVLREARRGWLRYEGKGIEGPGPHAMPAFLNGVELGPLAAAGGDETTGKFAQGVGLPLSAAALRALGVCNRFVLKNPNRDCFSVRRLWLELELADGRRCSSEIASATFSQPLGWRYAEGERVAEGEDLAAYLAFPKAAFAKAEAVGPGGVPQP